MDADVPYTFTASLALELPPVWVRWADPVAVGAALLNLGVVAPHLVQGAPEAGDGALGAPSPLIEAGHVVLPVEVVDEGLHEREFGHPEAIQWPIPLAHRQ